MKQSRGPVIDMTPDGKFIDPPKPSMLTYLLRLALFGVGLAAIFVLIRTMVVVLPLLFLAGAISFWLLRPRFIRPGPPRGY